MNTAALNGAILETLFRGEDCPIGFFFYGQHVPLEEMRQAAIEQWNSDYDEEIDPAGWKITHQYMLYPDAPENEDYVPFDISETPKDGYEPVTFAIHDALLKQAEGG